MRVLQIGMVYNLGGGIQTFLMNYYNNINRENIQFDFINIYGDKFYYRNQINMNGGIVYDLPNYYKHPIKFIKQLKKIINDGNYEIVHCNMNSAAMLHPLIACKLSKAKIVISHSHNTSSDKGILKSILHNLNKHFIPWLANYYFACSNAAGKWFYSKRILKSNKYFVIKNAIDTDKFTNIDFDITEYKDKLGVKKYNKVLLNVGRFTKQKNQKFLISLFKEYHKVYNDSVLLLVGNGKMFEQLKEENINDDSIKFLGRRDDVNKIMKVSDIFILPSLYEGLPLVGIEAQYCGLPCIFSNSITDELSISNQVSFLSLNDSKDIWINEIDKMIGKKNTINDDCYNIKNESKRLENIYLKLLKSGENNDNSTC